MGGVLDKERECVRTRTAIQRGLSRMEKWASRSLMKFSKREMQGSAPGEEQPLKKLGRAFPSKPTPLQPCQAKAVGQLPDLCPPQLILPRGCLERGGKAERVSLLCDGPVSAWLVLPVLMCRLWQRSVFFPWVGGIQS